MTILYKGGMENIEITREQVLYQLKGLEMTLKYLRDALMLTFMDISVDYFIELKGNLPLYMGDRMPFLDAMASNIDVQFFKDAKSHIFNTNDKELAERFCKLDLLIWQITILASRYERRDKVVKHIGEVAGELLRLVYFLKEDVLHRNFFDFNTSEVPQMALFLERVANEKNKSLCPSAQYAGWKQLEDAAKNCDEKGKINVLNEAESELANCGRFEMRSALDPDDIKRLYQFLGDYRTGKGPKSDVGIIDSSIISLKKFEEALIHGYYTDFEKSGLQDKLHFVICHFSKAYVKDTAGYRKMAARSMNISNSCLTHYNKDDKFAFELKKILPLIQYNKLK